MPSQVLLSQVHRLRALDLLGRFLDLGPWAVSLVSSCLRVHAFDEQTEDLELLFQLEQTAPACGPIEGQLCFAGPDCICVQALSVGIFPYVLKLLQSSARELRPLLVFIWAKILAVDSVSCVKY